MVLNPGTKEINQKELPALYESGQFLSEENCTACQNAVSETEKQVIPVWIPDTIKL
jgi:hypothetical protein